jgi:hypothetical protein
LLQRKSTNIRISKDHSQHLIEGGGNPLNHHVQKGENALLDKISQIDTPNDNSSK